MGSEIRKPRPVSKGNKTMPIWDAAITPNLWVDLEVHSLLDPDGCEKIADWLVRAAAWIRQREERER